MGPAPFYLIETDVRSVSTAAALWSRDGSEVRVVRGRKMRTKEGLLNEFSAAWQFPEYFGENYDALRECLIDLDTWLPHAPYVTVVRDCEDVLSDAAPVAGRSALAILIEIMEDARAEFAVGRAHRPPLPFHVVLHAERGWGARAERIWRRAGGDVVRVDVG